MDSLALIFDDGPLTPQHLLVFVAASLTSLVIYKLFFATDHDAPIAYSIPIPEQCSPEWNGRVLEEPKIKVSYLCRSGLKYLTTRSS